MPKKTYRRLLSVDPPPGFFVLSKPQSHRGSLARMDAFLKGKGIKTEILQSEQGKYFLCREGEELKTYQV